MTTAEVKLAEEGIGGLVCLKFWMLDSQDKLFSLSTIVYEPHRYNLSITLENVKSLICCSVNDRFNGITDFNFVTILKK